VAPAFAWASKALRRQAVGGWRLEQGQANPGGHGLSCPSPEQETRARSSGSLGSKRHHPRTFRARAPLSRVGSAIAPTVTVPSLAQETAGTSPR